MILAAGRGTRMGTLTDKLPKPLINLAGMPLIEYHVRALAADGFDEIVINTAYRGEQIEAYLGNGNEFGVSIAYSRETQGALETGGGINKALPLLGGQPFLVVNGDIWSDFPYSGLRVQPGEDLAHLIMVDNPEHNRGGDFGVEQSRLTPGHKRRYTFSGIGVYDPEFFNGCSGAFTLAPLMRSHLSDNRIGASVFTGHWWDVGTIQRLHRVEQFLRGD